MNPQYLTNFRSWAPVPGTPLTFLVNYELISSTSDDILQIKTPLLIIFDDILAGELDEHCVQHQQPDQAEDEDWQNHPASHCHSLSLSHLRVPSGEKLRFSFMWVFRKIFFLLSLIGFELMLTFRNLEIVTWHVNEGQKLLTFNNIS